MFSEEDIWSIPFPKENEYKWYEWPEIIEYISLPPNVDYWFASEMPQLCAIVTDGELKHAIVDHANSVGLLNYLLTQVLFQEDTWNELSWCFGADVYFWFCTYWESECHTIEEFPEWCQEVWQILVSEGIISVYNCEDSFQKRYCVWSTEKISDETLRRVYQSVLPVFSKEIVDYREGEDDPELCAEKLVEKAERIIYECL